MLVADARALPFRSSTIDLIISNPPFPGPHLFWDDYDQELAAIKRECLRVLRYTGSLLLLEPDLQWRFWGKYGGGNTIGPGRWKVPSKQPGWGVFYEEDIYGLILRYSRPGNVVLDPMAGSGIVADMANSLGRVGFASDISTWASWS